MPRMGLHKAQELDDARIVEMMCEQAADDEIGRLRGAHYLTLAPLSRLIGRSPRPRPDMSSPHRSGPD
jgi:hypothetical protein